MVRNPALRWRVDLPDIQGERVADVRRRAKYLLIELESGGLILHLGMSGHLSVVTENHPPQTHDHVDLVFDHGMVVRFTDPRRFGSLHWQPLPLEDHWLLARLGPEPLSDAFDADHLHAATRNRRSPIKTLLMNARVVVGVGNIYANEALFRAGVRPRRAARRITRAEARRITQAVKQTLAEAIEQGGTTLRDFAATDGKPGYFAQELLVYGHGGKPCRMCATPLKELRLGNRATVYCPSCQT